MPPNARDEEGPGPPSQNCVALSRTFQDRRVCALLATAAAPTIVRDAREYSVYPSLSFLLVSSLVGFALVMPCVRLVELPSRRRRRTVA